MFLHLAACNNTSSQNSVLLCCGLWATFTELQWMQVQQLAFRADDTHLTVCCFESSWQCDWPYLESDTISSIFFFLSAHLHCEICSSLVWTLLLETFFVHINCFLVWNNCIRKLLDTKCTKYAKLAVHLLEVHRHTSKATCTARYMKTKVETCGHLIAVPNMWTSTTKF